MAEWAIHGCAGTPVGVFAGVVIGSLVLRVVGELVRLRRRRRRG